ncbi:MAG: ComEC/Rec2 family competence protein [Phyllobacterium sp.]
MLLAEPVQEIKFRTQISPLPVPSDKPPAMTRQDRQLWLQRWFHNQRFRNALHRSVAEESEHGAFFLCFTALMGAGAIAYFSATAEPTLRAIILGLIVLLGLCHMARNRPTLRTAGILALALVAGMLCAKLETLRRGTAMLGSDITTRMTGRVTEVARNEQGQWRLTIDVTATERPTLRYAPDRVRLTARQLPDHVTVGTGLKGLVRLRAQSGPVRPGNYDFSFHGYFRGIGATGFFLGQPEKIEVGRANDVAGRILSGIAGLRQELTERIMSRLEGERGAIAAALITGQREAISEETNDALRLAGIYHILSISGLHMALVAATIMSTLRAATAFFPGVSARYPIKKYAAAIAIGASAFYLVLSGNDVATQRSFIMLCVMLLAVILDRAAITMRNLAIAALITIAVAPHELLGPSFQMSFSATAALIAAYGWWSLRKGGEGEPERAPGTPGNWLTRNILRYIGGIAMTSLVAGAASTIFAAYHFNNTAPLGLLGNALALPVVSVLVMPFALIALILIPFDLDWVPFQIMGQGIGLVNLIARYVASVSPQGNIGTISPFALLALASGLIVLLLPRTWIRLLAIPLFMVGAILFWRSTSPDIAVSEDGRLVAVRAINALAINTSRPNNFTLSNWVKAYGVSDIVKPNPDLGEQDTLAFQCEEGFCLYEEGGGLMIAYTEKPENQRAACAVGDIVILAFAAKKLRCEETHRLVVTAQDLATKGALEIRFPRTDNLISDGDSGSLPYHSSLGKNLLAERLAGTTLSFAIGNNDRPWHHHRIYSRTARGLPERSPRKSTAAANLKN